MGHVKAHKGASTMRRTFLNLCILIFIPAAVVSLVRSNRSMQLAVPLVMRSLDLESVDREDDVGDGARPTQQQQQQQQQPGPKRKPMLPNLLLAGTQKGGTTAVDNYMREHNMVCSAQEKRDFNGFKYTSSKEVHFFDITERFSKGLYFYMDLYSHCNFERDNKYLIDSTPNYQLHPERIYKSYMKYDPEALKSLRIVFTVREPVAREMSWFNHWSNSNRWLAAFPKGHIPSFEKDYLPELIEKREKRALKGYYFKWFQKWFKFFDRKNILIMSYDEIKNEPNTAMQRVHEFLNMTTTATGTFTTTTIKNTLKEKAATDTKETKAFSENEEGSKAVAAGGGIAGKGVIANRLSTAAASCEMQEEMLSWFQEDTKKFYKLLQDNPGPPMEQRPFPKFKFTCYKSPGGFATQQKANQ